MAAKKKYAFISYSHRDERIARWLQRKLESYKLPSEIHNEFEDSKYLRPIFRDRADLSVGVLSNELVKHLECSKFLVVICSPHSAASEWVNNEIRTFLEWGRSEYIIPFIVSGDITSQGSDNPIPPVLREYFAQYPERELLGVDIREAGAIKAYIRVVSHMLDIEFDELWRRHLRARRRRVALAATLTVLLTAMAYWFATPVSLSVEIQDETHSLPMPEDATIVVDGTEYRLSSLDGKIVIEDLPGYYRLRDIDIDFESTYYNELSETIQLGAGTTNSVVLALKRDDSFGVFAGRVLDSDTQPIEGVCVTIDNQETYTNSLGEFRIEIPLPEQSIYKSVLLTKSGFVNYEREDECPSENITYIMRKEKH